MSRYLQIGRRDRLSTQARDEIASLVQRLKAAEQEKADLQGTVDALLVGIKKEANLGMSISGKLARAEAEIERLQAENDELRRDLVADDTEECL